MKQNLLKKSRNAKNLTQQQVAEHVGVLPHHIYMLESGRRMPSVETAKRLGELLGFHWSKLFD